MSDFGDEMEQRSLGWYRARMGKITGSKVSVLIGTGRRKGDIFTQTGMTYIYQLAAERVFNEKILQDDEMFAQYVEQMNVTSKAIKWGIEQEANAARLYKMTYHDNDGTEILEDGSVTHPTIPNFAASPDRMLRNADGKGNMRVIEIKSPNPSTYMCYKTNIFDAGSLKAYKPEYYWQMMAEMDCTETNDGDFVCFCPWLKSPLFVAHIERNEEDIELMEAKVTAANKLIDEIIADELGQRHK